MAVNKSGYLLWLADALRAGGLPVYEMPGWQTRGHANFNEVRGVMCHHTASGNASDAAALGIVANGVTGLKGPLSQLGLGKDGTVWVIAAGVSWHAGTGVWPWLPQDSGNYYSIGIEAVSAGTYDDWTPAQRTNYPKMCAALLKALELPGDRVVAHKEYSNAGKIDPAYWDMNQFRTTVKNILASGGGGSSSDGDDDMTPDTPVSFSSNIKGYFDATGGPGFGDIMASQFPAGGTAGFGVMSSWDAMSSRAAYYKAVAVEQKLDALSAKIDQLLAK